MNVVTLENVHFSYGSHPVINGVTRTITSGESVCITGDNGSGKSTLLKLIVGDLRPTSGRVEVMGQPVHGRRVITELGYVPQFNALGRSSFPVTSRELVVQGLASEFGMIRIPRAEHYRRAEEVLGRLDLSDFSRTPFSALSGGLQQRVMIARALIHDPQVIILDEPTAGVDKESRAGFFRLLEDLRAHSGITIVLVTHELSPVMEHMEIDTMLTIDGGQLLENRKEMADAGV